MGSSCAGVVGSTKEGIGVEAALENAVLDEVSAG